MIEWKIAGTTVVVIVILVATGIYFTSSIPVNHREYLLKMNVSVSDFSINQGQNLTINLALYNPYPVLLPLNRGDTNPVVQGLLYPGDPVLCGYSAPYSFGVLKGYYGINNYSDGQPLIVSKPAVEIVMCPVIGPITGYIFYPLSDVITITGYNSRTFNDQYSVVVNGTWFVNGSDILNWSTISRISPGYNASGANLEYFSPGVYTVIAGDEWGDIQIVHFTVLKPT